MLQASCKMTYADWQGVEMRHGHSKDLMINESFLAAGSLKSKPQHNIDNKNNQQKSQQENEQAKNHQPPAHHSSLINNFLILHINQFSMRFNDGVA